jgi:hypothetical protein
MRTIAVAIATLGLIVSAMIHVATFVSPGVHRDLMATLSPAGRTWTWGLGAYLIGLFVWHIVEWNGGTLGTRDGHSALLSHGVYIRQLTDSEVVSFRASETRLFSGGWMLAFLGPMLIWRKHDA